MKAFLVTPDRRKAEFAGNGDGKGGEVAFRRMRTTLVADGLDDVKLSRCVFFPTEQ